MAVKLGDEHGNDVTPTMNVTPLIDVVLVLLIVFMVITPMLNKQFYVHLPKQEQDRPDNQPDDPASRAIILSVDKSGVITINGEVIALDGLVEKLRRIYAARDDHSLFFEAADDAPYGTSVVALDKAREGGAVTIAIITDKLGGDAVEGSRAP